MDITKHNLEAHVEAVGDEETVLRRYNADGTAKPTELGQVGHSEAWYKTWPINKGAAKCPTCGVAAEFKNEKEK